MHCIVCENDNRFTTYLKSQKHHSTYWRCADCGFVFAFPRIPYSYDNYAFQPVQDMELPFRLKNYELRFSHILKYWVKNNNNLLDIGAYTGIFLLYVKQFGIDGLGIEVSRPACEYARKAFGVNMFVGDFESYNTDIKYDIITMFNVLEHVSDPNYVLKKAQSMLNKDGLLVVEIPHIFTLQASLSLGYWHHFDRWHYWFFSKNTISLLLERCGFVVETCIFIPKIVSMARCFDVIMSASKIYEVVSIEKYEKIRRLWLYRVLNNIMISFNCNDYLFLVARNAGS